jgi:hypothetical protein
MRKLVILPDSDSYSFIDPEETVMIQLDGGAPRTRTDVLNGAYTLQAQWTLDQANYDYFRSFYKVVLFQDAGNFLCDLITDDPNPVEHKCIFVPGSLSLVSQVGHKYVVSCKMMVTPNPVNYADLIAKLEIIEAYGSVENAQVALNLLDELANQRLPRIQP